VIDSIIEAVKFFGGLGGLASSAFLTYDRIFRFRPTAFLLPVQYKTSVRFKNIAAETIIIDEIVVTPPIVKVMRANDLQTANEDRSDVWYPSAKKEKPDVVFIVIKAMDERTFALHRSAEVENSDGKRVIKIRCRWRNTRKPFPFARHVTIKATVEDIQNLREASLANKV
jgi:hypothetical protein